MRFQKEEFFVFMLSRGKCRLLGLKIWVWYRRLNTVWGRVREVIGSKRFNRDGDLFISELKGKIYSY